MTVLAVSGDAKAKSKKTPTLKLELMKKKDRRKLRKMKNPNFEMAAKAKALWEECRRCVKCSLRYSYTFGDLVKFYAVIIIFLVVDLAYALSLPVEHWPWTT